LLAAEWLRPGSVFTLPSASSWSLLALQLASLSGGAVFLTAASDTTWSLRRRVFQMRSLGRYRLLERIGEGGHGEVWRAYDSRTKGHVAIKVLRNEIADNDRATARFERETHALSILRHPHTVQILDSGLTPDGVCYYVMELLEGQTLCALVRAQGPLEPDRARGLLLQAAEALAEAHGHGIVHRDIKPENVFVLASVPDFVKLLDFGIAKHLPSSASLTRQGMVVGTPAFMAPEVERGDPADFRADVYALGAVAYFALTGAPPDRRTVERHASTCAAQAGQRSASVFAPDLEHVVLRCLARDPCERYPDASALACALASLRTQQSFRLAPSEHERRDATSADPTHTAPSA
jgi:serine/threonine-protein kinase